MPYAACVGQLAPHEPGCFRGCPFGNDRGSSEYAQKKSVSFTGIGEQNVPPSFQPSPSGKGHSGVRRVTGSRPSSPFRTSRRNSDPLVKLWCALAVATRSGEFGIAFTSVPTQTFSE